MSIGERLEVVCDMITEIESKLHDLMTECNDLLDYKMNNDVHNALYQIWDFAHYTDSQFSELMPNLIHTYCETRKCGKKKSKIDN